MSYLELLWKELCLGPHKCVFLGWLRSHAWSEAFITPLALQTGYDFSVGQLQKSLYYFTLTGRTGMIVFPAACLYVFYNRG